MCKLLSVEKLSKSFKKNGRRQEVLHEVSFDLEKGETLGILGASGSGKTTLINIIAGFEKATSGQLWKKDNFSVHMVFQNPVTSFNPRFKLKTALTEGLVQKGLTRRDALQKITDLLLECGLEENYLEAYPHQLSGGQCQRAAIVRALAAEPELLICDELTSALDVLTQEQIMYLLKKLRQERAMSIIFVTHNERLAADFCQRMIRL